MTRHGRNSTAGAVYTYHERKKDTGESGYGSKEVRFGKDSVKEFDCCCLTLQPCQNPVITQDGYLFDKEAILEYIIQKKRDIARKLKEFEKQKTKLQREATELGQAERESQVQNFLAKEKSMVTKPVNAFKSADDKAEAGTSKSISNMQTGKNKTMPSFWLPSLTPDAKPTLVEKPDEKVRCPMTGKPLRLKDLIDVKFTLLQDKDDKRSLIAKDARYVCAVSHDVLGNQSVAVLRTSGSVVTSGCVEKIIRKDMIDPTNNKPLTEKDIIPLQRGATGFAGAGVKLEAKIDGAAMMA